MKATRRLFCLSAAGAIVPPALGAQMAVGAVPSPRQRRWHAREYYGFIHFGMDTFTNREWGYGDESPADFALEQFDADQIARAAAQGGMRALIFTAKHHDGFCLWPTRTTAHSVAASPYRGDLVGEMAAACRRAGLGFGIYLSPWDRNRADYGTPAYVEVYKAQLAELCSHYGPLCEVWFDGANGGDGYFGGARETRRVDGRRYYDWPALVAMVRALQPDACIFGPDEGDIRWIGNENGIAADPCWPTMPIAGDAPLAQGLEGGARWWPAEADVPIRPNWFYHPSDDGAVKGPARLMALYDQSVGRGANLLLNLSPDRRGRLPDGDVAALSGFGAALAATFGRNLAKGARREADFTLRLAGMKRFNLIRLREDLALGLRARGVVVEAQMGAGWREVGRAPMIGVRRHIVLDAPVEAQALRLRFDGAKAEPVLAEWSLFLRPDLPADPAPIAARHAPRAGWRILSASAPGAERLILPDAPPWTAPAPAQVVVDLGQRLPLVGLSLRPAAQDPAGHAPPTRYRIEGGKRDETWELVGEGELANIVNARSPRDCLFSIPMELRYLRITLMRPADGAQAIALGGVEALLADGLIN